ncbi:MAG: hypothetical protein RI564_06600 [Gracilimonas sp.]|nr:hypothetical protein [Gracilimonas sp.]
MFPAIGFSQSNTYDLDIYPDLWYNSVDGVRVGGFVLGQMEGEFKSGPHRLDAGVWLGTNFPDLPVSYYVSFTEPLNRDVIPGNEANVQVQSSIRTGYSQHGVSFNKRWQPGFNELVFREISVGVSQEKVIDNNYRLIPFQETDWKTLAGLFIETSGFTPFGDLKTNVSFQHNLSASSSQFSVGKTEIKHVVDLGKGFGINMRLFGALTSSNAPQEYHFSAANRDLISWLNNGFTRATGTIPKGLFENGLLQISGGFNLRGYNIEQFTSALSSGDQTKSYLGLIDKGISINSEVIFPNYINSLLKRTIVGDFVHLNSYLFYDIGKLNGSALEGDVLYPVDKIFADAGIGLQFSVNIPDWLGKDRDFAIRYDLPLWLSDPNGLLPVSLAAPESSQFKFRGILGIGAVISL